MDRNLFLGSLFCSSAYLPELHYRDYCGFVPSFEIRKYELLNLFFFTIVLAVQGLLKALLHFRKFLYLDFELHLI